MQDERVAKSDRRHRSFSWAALAVASILLSPGASALPPSPTTCYAIVTVAIVCTQWDCTSTSYVDDYWCTRTFWSDVNPPELNPSDVDADRQVDDFKDVLATDDPCAWQFDENDRLGTNYGGPSSTRPDHRGVDIQANRGDDVAAVGHGRVSFVGWQDPSNHNAGCGYMMVVDHANGDTSTYCHLVADSETRLQGDWVRAGSVIASANSTGHSFGDHLHLVYKLGGTDRVEYWDAIGDPPSAGELNGNC